MRASRRSRTSLLQPGPFATAEPNHFRPVLVNPAVALTLTLENWLACEACHALIVAGDLDGLVRRALRENADPLVRVMANQPVAIDYTTSLYRQFWQARRGRPYRVAA